MALTLPKGIKLETLKSQVADQYAASFNTINRKRMTFRERDKLYNDSFRSDIVDVKIIQGVHTTMLSLMTDNERKVRFTPANLMNRSIANSMEKITKHLHHKMNVDNIYPAVIDNKLKYGVGLRVMLGYDDVSGAPIWKRIDTRSWVPDPQGSLQKEFRWEGFEEEISYYELKQFADKDTLSLVNNALSLDSETNLTKIVSYSSSGLNQPQDVMLSDHGKMVGVYHHFCRIDGRVIYSLWSSGRTVCHYCVEIEPVYKDEKKDKNKVKFPIAHNRFHPKVMDPFGGSLTELMYDKHMAQNILFNLMLFRERDMALGDDVIFDSRSGLNLKNLAIPSLTRRFIPVDGTRVDINKSMINVPKVATQQSTINAFDMLQRAIETSTTIDSRQMGITGGRRTTLGEASQLQANNNIRSIFYDNNNLLGEKEFWHHSLRCVAENVGPKDKIISRIAGMAGQTMIEFYRQDLIGEEMPEIEVISKFKEEEQRQKDMVNILPLLQQKLVDPTVSPALKRMYEREALVLVGLDYDSALYMTGMSAEEMDANDKLLLLNNNDIDGAEISKIDVDHEVYIKVFQQGLPTAAREAAISARKQAIIQAGLNKQNAAQANIGMGGDPSAPGAGQGPQEGLQKQTGAMAMNQMMNNMLGGGGSAQPAAVSRMNVM